MSMHDCIKCGRTLPPDRQAYCYRCKPKTKAEKAEGKKKNPVTIRGWVRAKAVKIVRNKRGQAVAVRIKT